MVKTEGKKIEVRQNNFNGVSSLIFRNSNARTGGLSTIFSVITLNFRIERQLLKNAFQVSSLILLILKGKGKTRNRCGKVRCVRDSAWPAGGQIRTTFRRALSSRVWELLDGEKFRTKRVSHNKQLNALNTIQAQVRLKSSVRIWKVQKGFRLGTQWKERVQIEKVPPWLEGSTYYS